MGVLVHKRGWVLKGGMPVAAMVVALCLGSSAAADGRAPAKVGGCRGVGEQLAHRHHLVGPGEKVDQILCHDFTRDGRQDIAFDIFSGGTAGDVQWGVFVKRADGGYALVAYHPDTYGIQLRRVGDDLLVSTPVYAGSAPNCCPTYFVLDHWRYNPSTGVFYVYSSHTRKHYPFARGG